MLIYFEYCPAFHFLNFAARRQKAATVYWTTTTFDVKSSCRYSYKILYMEMKFYCVIGFTSSIGYIERSAPKVRLLLYVRSNAIDSRIILYKRINYIPICLIVLLLYKGFLIIVNKSRGIELLLASCFLHVQKSFWLFI